MISLSSSAGGSYRTGDCSDPFVSSDSENVEDDEFLTSFSVFFRFVKPNPIKDECCAGLGGHS